MKYVEIAEAIFVDRPNRFVAHVRLNGEQLAVHVKNTGRCRELLIPGVRVILARSAKQKRKYLYDLVTVYKDSVGWINLDSQAPNAVVKEWLSQSPDVFPGLTLFIPERVYGESRFDFYLEQGEKKTYMEVKGCTLERDRIGYFPDAPTARGVKHLKELVRAKQEGYEACLAFVIAMEQVPYVLPNREMDLAFGAAFDEAVAAGVKVLFLRCEVTPDTLKIIKSDTL